MAAQGQQEYVIRVPRKGDQKRFSVLKFNEADNVDASQWTAQSEVTLEREDNRSVVMSSQAVQEFGEGSEYGKAAREEARRKKYGRQSKSYNLDHQPWHLNFRDPNGRERKMNSIREGDGHADYWVFLKSNDEFHAYKIDDMHRFIPAIKHKTLDIDQAEEKFLQRNKVMNQFALKAQIMQMKADEEEKEIATKKAAHLKIKDGYSSDESDGDGDGEEEGSKIDKNKKKKAPTKRKDKRQRVDHGDDVAKYESEDGEDEGREYDYMSDSGSDSDREQVKVDEKVDRELVGVGDETGLKKMMDSDEEDSESDGDFNKKILNGDDKKGEGADVEERDSSGSDSEDPDRDRVDSVVFMPKKDLAGEASIGGKKRPATGGDDGTDPKKAKSESFVEGLNEETVRKYLRRKPHTTKELISRIKGKCGDVPKAEIVAKLAAILKAIDPHQFKQKQGKKEVLFFSLTNNLA